MSDEPLTLREQLIAALRRVPFVPFVVELKTFEVYAVSGVEQMSVARELFTVVATDGTLRIHSFPAIESITVRKD